jgi:hypothetical protein
MRIHALVPLAISVWILAVYEQEFLPSARADQRPNRTARSEDRDAGRLRLIIETDAGGDPDDEQSLVRFLLYANEWDVEGIIANRVRAIDKENRNPERTGLGIVRRQLKAYERCYPSLVRHDRRYPDPKQLWQRTVPGYDDTDDGVRLILAAVDRADLRPIWYLNWGTGHGAATSCLKRALDRVLRQRGQEGYAKFKNGLRLSSDDQFGEHTTRLTPAWKLWVDTYRPPLEGKRWYHRFSALTATAGGFDLERDVRTGHGPLGALYPTNTTHRQKEGDTMTFLYLVPTGMNDPNEPTWGSWAGRYGLRDDSGGRAYYWANRADTWQGRTHRDNTLARWAVHLQNDFRARLTWCVKPFGEANHPPRARVDGALRRTVAPGDLVKLSAAGSTDPDGDALAYHWDFYPEPSTYAGSLALRGAATAEAGFRAPLVKSPRTIHIILTVSDNGKPSLTRYQRVIVTVVPRTAKRPDR